MIFKINGRFLKHYELLLKYFEDYLIAFDNILLVFLIITTIDYRLFVIYLKIKIKFEQKSKISIYKSRFNHKG